MGTAYAKSGKLNLNKLKTFEYFRDENWCKTKVPELNLFTNHVIVVQTLGCH